MFLTEFLMLLSFHNSVSIIQFMFQMTEKRTHSGRCFILPYNYTITCLRNRQRSDLLLRVWRVCEMEAICRAVLIVTNLNDCAVMSSSPQWYSNNNNNNNNRRHRAIHDSFICWGLHAVYQQTTHWLVTVRYFLTKSYMKCIWQMLGGFVLAPGFRSGQLSNISM